MADSDSFSEPMQVDAPEFSEDESYADIVHGPDNSSLLDGIDLGIDIMSDHANLETGTMPETKWSLDVVPKDSENALRFKEGRKIVTGGTGENKEEEIFYNIENPNIDLESYVQQYTGLTIVLRLKFIARHCPFLRIEALKLALQYLQSTSNTSDYIIIEKQLLSIATRIPQAQWASDPVSQSHEEYSAEVKKWVQTCNKQFSLKLEKLDTDLKNFKSNSIKESIRRGQDDLGDHYLDRGDLNNALKSYIRARDYCTSWKQMISMCVNVIRVSIYMENWPQVVAFVNKAKSSLDHNLGKKGGQSKAQVEESNSITTRIYCAKGLSELAMSNYNQAATSFLLCLYDNFENTDLISPQNVTTYGVLCAMATYSRIDLHGKVINSRNFKSFLELDPPLREILSCFYLSKYSKCLKMLQNMKDTLLCDMYLASHVNQLFKMIRSKAIVQYFSPYSSVKLNEMSLAFNMNAKELESELVSLILEGQVKAKIDSYNKILYAENVNKRIDVIENTIQTAKEFKRSAKHMLFRSALLKHNVVVKGDMSNLMGLRGVQFGNSGVM